MASATVDSPPDSLHLRLDSIPTVDLRLLSQAELHALSLCSASAYNLRRCDDVVIPKIDRSVFNESAGSRKQTYSRLRLAPRNPSISAAITSRKSQPISAADAAEQEEQSRIIRLLKKLFKKDRNLVDLVPIAVECSEPLLEKSVDSVDSGRKRKRGRPSRSDAPPPLPPPPEIGDSGGDDDDDSVKDNVGLMNGDNVEDTDAEIVNKNGVVVDVRALANMQDPFGSELRRRTAGLETKEALLGFMSELNGRWCSRRKKRMVVDADEFGDALPIGWKLMLSIKRKKGHCWVVCRQYMSPSGRHFISCKEVSSYLNSFFELHDENLPDSGQSNEYIQLADKVASGSTADFMHKEEKEMDDLDPNSPSPNASIPSHLEKTMNLVKTGNLDEVEVGKVLKCHKCSMAFNEKDDLLNHLQSCQKRKRSKKGAPIVDDAMDKDGKYECQFCDKVFQERSRYNGHIGFHVKHYVKSVESGGVKTMQNANDPKIQASSRSDRDSIGRGIDTKVTDEQSDGSFHHNLKSYGNITTRTELHKEIDQVEANTSRKELVEKSCDELDKNRVMEVVDKGNDTIAPKLNSDFKVEAALSNDRNNGIGSCESFDEAIVSKGTINEVNVTSVFASTREEAKIDIDSGNGSLNPNRDEKTRGTETTSSSHSACPMEDSDDEPRFSSSHDSSESEDIDTEVKQQISCEHSFFSSGHDQTCEVKEEAIKVSTITVEELKLDEAENHRKSVLAIKDAVTSVEQERISENCSGLQPWNTQTRSSIRSMEELDQENGFEITFGVENKGNEISTGKSEELKFDEGTNCRDSEPIFGFGSSQTRPDVGVVAQVDQGTSLKACSLGSFGNEQTIGSENDVSGCQPRVSGIQKNCLVVDSVNDRSRHTILGPRIDEAERTWNGELINNFNSNHSGLDMDVNSVEWERGFDSCALQTRQTFDAENYVNAASYSAVEETQLERRSEENLIGPSAHELNRNCAPTWEPCSIDDVEIIGNNELMIDFGSNHAPVDTDGVADFIWRTDEENAPQRDLPDSSSMLPQPSGCFPTYNFISEKGGNGIFTDNEKFDNISSFDGLSLGGLGHTEFSFLDVQNTNPCRDDSKVYSYAAEMEKGFDSSVWLQKDDAPLPKLPNVHQITTICMWCRNEFPNEACDFGPQTSSIGFICSDCKAKISDQLKFF